MVFAEFRDQFDRDLAVTLLKTAGLQQNGRPVWAGHDRGPVEELLANFALAVIGLKKVFKEEWNRSQGRKAIIRDSDTWAWRRFHLQGLSIPKF